MPTQAYSYKEMLLNNDLSDIKAILSQEEQSATMHIKMLHDQKEIKINEKETAKVNHKPSKFGKIIIYDRQIEPLNIELKKIDRDIKELEIHLESLDILLTLLEINEDQSKDSCLEILEEFRERYFNFATSIGELYPQ